MHLSHTEFDNYQDMLKATTIIIGNPSGREVLKSYLIQKHTKYMYAVCIEMEGRNNSSCTIIEYHLCFHSIYVLHKLITGFQVSLIYVCLILNIDE